MKRFRESGKSRCVKAKGGNGSWMCVTIAPSGGVVWETIILLWWTWPHGLRNFGTLENQCHITQSTAASRNATWNYIMPKGNINLYILRRNGEFSGPEVIWDGPKDSGNVFSGQTSPHFSLFLGKTDVRFYVPKMKKTIQTVFQQIVQKPASVMVWGCISAHGMGDPHICEGTIDAEAHVPYSIKPGLQTPPEFLRPLHDRAKHTTHSVWTKYFLMSVEFILFANVNLCSLVLLTELNLKNVPQSTLLVPLMNLKASRLSCTLWLYVFNYIWCLDPISPLLAFDRRLLTAWLHRL